MGDPITQDMEKAKVLNDFASVFTDKCSSFNLVFAIQDLSTHMNTAYFSAGV